MPTDYGEFVLRAYTDGDATPRPLIVPPTDHSRAYLTVKRLRLGHLLEDA